MTQNKLNNRIFTSDTAILCYLGLIAFFGHILVSGNYGYFLDEFYTIACSKHLSLGFVDLPPVAPALLALNTAILGISLPALHFLPALVSGLIVIITGLMVKQFGGGRFAVFLAGLSAMFVPVWMAVCTMYTYDFLDQLVLILLFLAIIFLIKKENLKIWLAIGAIAGVGLMTKPSMLFFIVALVLTILLTKYRKHLLTPWPWLGGLTALIIILPALIWQIQHGFPIAEYWHSYSMYKVAQVNPVEFIFMQVIAINLILLPLWVTGICYFFFHHDGKNFRFLGLLFIITLLLLLFLRANLQMPAPAYAMLIAGGSVAFEKFFIKKKRILIQSIYVFLIFLFGLIQAPNFMPILPVDNLVKYYEVVGGLTGARSIKYANDRFVELPNYIYNRLEWDTLVKGVAKVYFGISEAERKDTIIVAQNYGWAGAIDLLGEKLGLPKAACGQLNYYYFSTDHLDKKVWIIVGESADSLSPLFTKVSLAGIIRTKYRFPREMSVWVCREPKFTVAEAKQGIKKFD